MFLVIRVRNSSISKQVPEKEPKDQFVAAKRRIFWANHTERAPMR